MRTPGRWFALALPLALLATHAADGGPPWKLSGKGWRTDRAWYDGKAEVCVYRSTRTIYGVERHYRATAYTNKQRMDPATTVKAVDPATGVEVFKHHWSERVPTENYDYDFSTAVFLRTDDLDLFKLTVATQEDCGASFKQVWADGGGFRWTESVYLPGTGMREGRIADRPRLDATDALPLLLRSLPFESLAGGAEPTLGLLPSQQSTKRVPFDLVRRRVRVAARETLELPVGRVDAWRVELLDADGAVLARSWFAAEGDAPWLHAMVRYEGPGGVTHRLESIERSAYWERP